MHLNDEILNFEVPNPCGKYGPSVLVSITQLVWTMHNICKVRGSNPDHHQKKYGPSKLYYVKDYPNTS